MEAVAVLDQAVSGACEVTLRIQFILQRDRACDPAHVAVSRHRSLIDAGVRFSQDDGIRHTASRGIGENALIGFLTGEDIDRLHYGTGESIEVIRDILQITLQDAGISVDISGNALDLIGHAEHRILHGHAQGIQRIRELIDDLALELVRKLVRDLLRPVLRGKIRQLNGLCEVWKLRKIQTAECISDRRHEIRKS